MYTKNNKLINTKIVIHNIIYSHVVRKSGQCDKGDWTKKETNKQNREKLPKSPSRMYTKTKIIQYGHVSRWQKKEHQENCGRKIGWKNK